MTCCPVGKHPSIADIDRDIRAQQSATLAGQSTLAPSYSHIARTYGIRKATLLAHRDVCLAQRTGTPEGAVPVRSDGVPGRTAAGADGENASDSARYDRYGASVPALGDEGVDPHSGRATGPPGDGTDRRRDVPTPAHRVPARAAQHDADVAVRGVGQRVPGAGDASSSDGVGQSAPSAGDASVRSSRLGDADGVGRGRPPEHSRRPTNARARDPVQAERAQQRWSRVQSTSETFAVRRLANTLDDASDARGDASSNFRAHGSYIHEIACIIDDGAWRNTKTVNELVARWKIDRLRVLQYYRDASVLVRVSRGDIAEERENSLARWVKLFDRALEKDDPISLKVASDALKGYDAAAGIVDKSTRVQVNIAQSDEAKMFVSIFLDEAKGDPALLERIRRRLAEARDKLGDPTALLTTGAEVDAAE